jgi:hypothetical protein
VDIIDTAKWPLTAMLVSRRHRVMFMPIAKNANTSLKRLFVRLSDHPDQHRILADNVHSYLTSHKTGLRLSDYTPEEAWGLVNDERYFRFVVLRNPLARATSGYLSKFVRDRQFENPGIESPEVIRPAIDWVYAQRKQPPDYGRSITFEEFVDYLVSNDDDHLDTHFRSQESYLEGFKFDFVAVQENLRPLLKELENRFAKPVQIEHRNITARKRNVFRKRGASNQLPVELYSNRKLANDSQLMTAEIKSKLSRRFARDIELWQQAAEAIH